jgi:putative nucleotidyltransferase-like protein
MMPPEAELLVGCASAYATEAGAAHIAELAARELDWGLAVRMAAWHSLAPLLYRALASFPDRVPVETLADLRRSFRANAIRNTYLTSELIRIAGLLKERGVNPVAFKGPVLAHAIYGDVSLRQFVDLDILVRPSDLAMTRELLSAQGYTSVFSDLGADELSFFQCYEETFDKEDGIVCIDVHWQMNPQYFAYALDGDALWRRTIQMELQGTTVTALATPDLLLHLCVHGAKHGWARLAWICDVAVLIRRTPELDWLALVAEAASLGARRLLLLGVYLAYDLLGAVVPANLISLAQDDGVTVRLADEVERRMFSNPEGRAGVFQEWMIPTRAIESTRGRVRYLARRALSPTIDDGELIRLPRRLFALYYLLRPIRLAFAQGPRLVRDLVGLPAATPTSQR